MGVVCRSKADEEAHMRVTWERKTSGAVDDLVSMPEVKYGSSATAGADRRLSRIPVIRLRPRR